LGFYRVGGAVRCPRTGEPKEMLDLASFLRQVKTAYDIRNGKDFFFEGEAPSD
jgi:hypothetical protein